MKVIKIVAIAFLIGLTYGYIVPLLSGGTLGAGFAGAFGISNLALATGAASAFYAGLAAVANEFLIKKPGDLGPSRQRLSLTIDPQSLGRWVFGETAVGTDIVYSQQHKTKYVSYIVAAAAHQIDSFGNLYVEDELVTFNGDHATGSWTDILLRRVRIGTENQSYIPPLGDGLLWPVQARGRGIAHYQLRWALGSDKIGSSIPSRITQIVKGAPVYDPRLDTTVGGRGTHRANDQSTWQYNDGTRDIGANWALVVLFYILGWKNNNKLVFGVGVDSVNIDYDQVIAAANICDEVIDNKPRFRIGGILPTGNNHQHILTQLEAAIGGSISIQGGLWYIWAPNDDLTPFQTIHNTDIVRKAGIQFTPSGPIEDLYNTARGRYIEPAELYQAIYYPDVIEPTAIIEDGKDRVMPRDFSMVQDVSVAERVARHMVRRSRFSGVWTFSMGPKGLLFRPFDVTTLNLQETNNLDITVRIIAMTFNPTGVVQIKCVEEDTSIYDTSAALGIPITQLDTTAWSPATQASITNFRVQAIIITGSAGTSRIAYKGSWDDPGNIVQFTEAQIKVVTDTEWLQMPTSSFRSTSVVVTDFEPLTTYDFRLRHVTIFGTPGPWFTIQDTTRKAGLTHYDDIIHYYYQSTPPNGIGEEENDIWVNSSTQSIHRRISNVWIDITPESDTDSEAADLATILGDLDDIADGTTYFKMNADQGTGATRAVNSINSSYKYFRELSTQNITVSSTVNPTSGIVIDAQGLRGYTQTEQILNIRTQSPFTNEFRGNINTDGQVLAEGATSSALGSAAIVGNSRTTSSYGIIGECTASGDAGGVFGRGFNGVRGFTIQNLALSTGVYGLALAQAQNASGVTAEHSLSTGTNLRLGTGRILGDATFVDAVDILDTTDASSSTFGSFTTSGGAGIAKRLYVGNSTFLCSNASTGSNVVIGNGTNTGNQNIVLSAGSAGSKRNTQIGIYCDLIAGGGSRSSLGLVIGNGPVGISSGGNFAASHKMKWTVNGTEFWLALDRV